MTIDELQMSFNDYTSIPSYFVEYGIVWTIICTNISVLDKKIDTKLLVCIQLLLEQGCTPMHHS